jgi:hypothetical protein
MQTLRGVSWRIEAVRSNAYFLSLFCAGCRKKGGSLLPEFHRAPPLRYLLRHLWSDACTGALCSVHDESCHVCPAWAREKPSFECGYPHCDKVFNRADKQVRLNASRAPPTPPLPPPARALPLFPL